MDKCYTASGVPISDLVQALGDERLQWVYAERMEDTVLTWRDDLLNDTIDLERWNHGRAFGPQLELAWWRRGEQVQARALLTEGSAPEGIAWPDVPERWEPKEGDELVLLLGERDPEAPVKDKPLWSEARVPRYLAYPADASFQRVSILRRAYQEQGAIVAWRLLAIRQVSDV